MKTRTGFVSNSSSSSFYTPRGEFASVFDLGKRMLAIRNDDWEGTPGNDLDTEIRKLNRAEELGINPNTPIVFSTTNYETFIRLSKNEKGYDVDTCNNQDWDLLDADLRYSDEDSLSTKTNEIYFWWVEEGILGRPVTSEDIKYIKHRQENNIRDSWPKCQLVDGHFKAMVEDINGKIVCVECYKASGKEDMILVPAKKVNFKPTVILKPRLKLR